MKTYTRRTSIFPVWKALVISALILAVCDIYAQSAKSAATEGPAQISVPDTWSAGPNLPTALVRAVGVFFPTNGFFYAIGGRSADTAGSDSTHPVEFNPGTNAWATRASFFPDNQMNNMACAVLTVGGTPQIYCVGGSAAGATTATSRVFSYNPITDSMTLLTAADNWPGNAAGTILPGGFAVVANKLYIIGGFNINVAMTQQTWEFDPNAVVGSRWVQKLDYPVQRGYVPAAGINGLIYTAGGSSWNGTTLVDSADSFKFDPVANTWTPITNIPRAEGETRAVALFNQMWVLGGGRTSPNPSTEVDVYTPSNGLWTHPTDFVTPRRNFPADADGFSRIWVGGGYTTDGLTPQQTMEIFSLPAVQTAFSRKLHGGVPFDIALPITGPAGIECRSSGGAHTILVNFATTVTVSGATVTSGTGSATATASGSQVTVNLTGVTNAQRLTVTLNNVNDGTSSGDIPITMGVLAGDTNGNGAVNSSDVSQTKSRIGQGVGTTNFRSDVNVSNSFTSSDVALIKANFGALPP